MRYHRISLTLFAVLLCLAPSVAVSQEPRTAPEGAAPLTLAPSDVRVLGSSLSIAEVRDLEVLPDGSVWLLNSGEPFFVGFDAEGNVIGRHGASGGGPSEFGRPAGLLTGGLEGEAWAFDFIRHAFIRISEPGAERSEVAIPQEEIPHGTVRGGMYPMSPAVRTARLGDEVIVPWTTGTMDSGLAAYRTALVQADLAALDPRTGSVREFVALGEILEDLVRPARRVGCCLGSMDRPPCGSMNRLAQQPLSNEGVKLRREQCRREAPESETEFFARAADAQVAFRRAEDGEVTGFILQQEGREVLGRKVRN